VAASKIKKKVETGTTKSTAKGASSKGGAAKGATAKANKPAKAEKAKEKASKSDDGKRKLGMRGAAPWAARHAAKHAEEARARAASPPPPGSARATIRTPLGAEGIKQKISALHNALAQVKTHKKNMPKGFFDMGLVLKTIRDERLFEAKGFGTFDAFLEREMDLGRVTCLRLVRLTTLFQREAALELGMDRIFAALSAIEGDAEARPSGKLPPPPISTTVLPLKPPGRI
jgi:hypothetical protein